jgi:carbon storage regulator
MLVLTRKPGEQIVIGDDITVTLVKINDTNSVRIGVQAPKAIPVHRKEIQDRIDRGDPQ